MAQSRHSFDEPREYAFREAESQPTLGMEIRPLPLESAGRLMGRAIGHYQIGSLIGTGAMSEVYRGRDRRDDREVAIKILQPHLSRHPLALARLEREAKSVAVVSHPNILDVREFGVADSFSYLVMELLEGETLRARLRSSVLSWKEALPIAIAVAEGLEAAHQRGIIHRDLKPENIFITADGVPKILDFGIARIKPALLEGDGRTSSSEDIYRTMPGTVLGSVGYMSPEQARGESAEAPSDLFSFGCILYEMITGRRPFSRATEVETLAATFRDPPPSMRNSGNDIPPSLDAVVKRCLEKLPSARYESAHQLVVALRAASIAPLPVPSRVDSVWITALSNETGDPEWDYFCHGLAEGIVDCLARISNMRVIAPASDFPWDEHTGAARKIGERLGTKAALIGRVAPRGSGLGVRFDLVQMSNQSRLWCEQYHRMPGKMVGLAEEVAARFIEKSHLEVSHEEWQRATRLQTQSDEAYQLYLRGQYIRRTGRDADSTSALECFNQALDVDPAYPLPYVGAAQCYCSISGRVLPRGEAIAQARAAALRALELAPDLAEAHLTVALIRAGYDWDWSGADTAFQRALELKPSGAQTRLEYGLFLVQTGRADEASAELQRGQQLDPISPAAAVGAVWPFLHVAAPLRRCELAIERLKAVIEEWPSFVPAWVLLGTSYAMLDRLPKAVAAFHTALSYRGDDPEVLMRLAFIHGRRGDRDAAEELLANTCQRLSGSVAPVWLAIAHAGMGADDQAFTVLESACEERDPGLAQLKAEPMLDSLRGDPRFSNLLERVGLRG